MKKIIFISFALITILATSCTQDFSDPTVLSGTTWRCNVNNDVTDYVEFRFTSTSTVEIWLKPKSESVYRYQPTVNLVYSINDKTITIYANGDPLVGVIKNKTMTFAQWVGIGIGIFIKQ